jgi:glycosyltransferase involved in cell wall biosynthesis
MRVAVTVEQFWHVVPGGIATVTAELVRALASRPDVEVTGVSARHPDAPAEDFATTVPVRQLPLPRRMLYESWQWLRRPVVERATGLVDVVHDMGYVAPPSRAPLVATVHDLWFLDHPDHYTWHSHAVMTRGFELARREARLLVCPSSASIEACVAAGIERDRLRLLPWGVRARPLDEGEAASVVRRYGLERPYVLFSGTIEQRKNVVRLLHAFERLERTDVDLVLAGPPGSNPDAWEAELDAATTRLGARCKRLGAVPPHHLDALCSEASVVVYPSLGEGFGLPILFAMTQGAPVVTSKDTSTEEVAGDAAVLVDPLDVDSIAEGIEHVLTDRQLAASLREAGRRRAAGFTWERTATVAAAIYGEAAGR